jgi:hypothetical protein
VEDRRIQPGKRPRYQPLITLGNLLTLLGMIAACFLFFLRYNDRLIMVEAAQMSSDQRDSEFRREILQRLQDLQTDVRELRSERGVRWKELPPSPFRRER